MAHQSIQYEVVVECMVGSTFQELCRGAAITQFWGKAAIGRIALDLQDGLKCGHWITH